MLFSTDICAVAYTNLDQLLSRASLGSRAVSGKVGVVIKGVAVKTILSSWPVGFRGAPSESNVGT